MSGVLKNPSMRTRFISVRGSALSSHGGQRTPQLRSPPRVPVENWRPYRPPGKWGHALLASASGRSSFTSSYYNFLVLTALQVAHERICAFERNSLSEADPGTCVTMIAALGLDGALVSGHGLLQSLLSNRCPSVNTAKISSAASKLLRFRLFDTILFISSPHRCDDTYGQPFKYAVPKPDKIVSRGGRHIHELHGASWIFVQGAAPGQSGRRIPSKYVRGNPMRCGHMAVNERDIVGAHNLGWAGSGGIQNSLH